MTFSLRHAHWGLARLVLLMSSQLVLSCHCEQEQKKSAELAPPSSGRATHERSPSVQHSESTPLLRLNLSAYHTQISATASAIYLLTSNGLSTLTTERPPVHLPLAYEGAAALTDKRLVFFARGALHSLTLAQDPTLAKDKTQLLAEVKTMPYLLAASERHVAWVEAGTDKVQRLYSLRSDHKTPIYETAGVLTSLVIQAEHVFFLETLAPQADEPLTNTLGNWTLKRVPLDGGAAISASTWSGRTPALLFAHEQLFFYHGHERSVYRLSPDFAVTEIAAKDTVCSPFTVADDLYCAHVGGITRLSLTGNPSARLPIMVKSPITSLHFGPPGLLWVADVGPNQLELSLLALKK